MTQQRVNIDSCLVQKKTLISSRQLMLLKLDRQFCETFSDQHVFFANSRVWKCCFWELCHEFLKISRKIDYSTVSVRSMSDIVESVADSELCSLVDDMSQTYQECVYYVAGWTLSASEKVARRRKKEFSDMLIDFVHHCRFGSDQEAIEYGLPVGKVGRIEAFGGLNYVISSCFEFIVCIDRIFTAALTKEAFIVNGSFIIKNIETAILSNMKLKELFLLFLNPNCFETHSTQLYLYIVHIYSQMRGKDFAFKMIEKNTSLKRTTCERIAVVADGTVNKGNNKVKIKKDFKSGSGSVYEFLFTKEIEKELEEIGDKETEEDNSENDD